MADTTEKSQWIVTLIAVAIIMTAMYLLQEILLPFALAVLLSFLLTPLVNRLERWRVPRVPAVIAAVLLAIVIVGGIFGLVGQQLFTLGDNLQRELADANSQTRQNLRARVRAVAEWIKQDDSPGSTSLAETAQEIQEDIAEATGEKVPPEEQADADDAPEPDETKGPLTAETSDAVVPVRVIEPDADHPLMVRLARDWLGPLLAPLGTAAIVFVFVFFILLERHDLRDRLIRLAGTRRVYVTTQAFDEAAGRVSRYLLMQLVINATYGIAVALGLYFIGMENALLWGLLATVFRFVPYIGPWIAATLPIALSLAFFEGWARPLCVVGLFVVLELFSNNVMEPWLYGSSTGVSTIGIIMSATFWTWLWGPVGLILSMPLTVCFVVLGRYVPQLNFLNILLSDEPPLELKVRFYQRLLAFDDYEANEAVAAFLRNGTLDELYENMLIPALSLSERDRSEGHLSEQQVRFIHNAISEIIEDQGEQFDASAAGAALPQGDAEEAAEASGPPPQRSLRILCLPAEDMADRLAGRMLVQLLVARCHVATSEPVRVITQEAVDMVSRERADCVVISALAPGGATPAREGTHSLRSRLPEVDVIVGLWNARRTIAESRKRITRAGAHFVTTSLAECMEAVSRLAQPAVDEQPAA
jgi:predicted PurR-regulated permease PerM